MSQGFDPVSCPTDPPASYQINRQLSGRNLPPLVTCAVGAHRIKRAKIPGGLEVAFKQIEEKQEITQDYVEQLRFIVKGFMTIHEYHHLQDIKSGKPYTVKLQHSVPLASELRRLRALGLIEQKVPDRGVTDFVIADGQERKPSDWFTLTKLEEEYLKMREEK